MLKLYLHNRFVWFCFQEADLPRVKILKLSLSSLGMSPVELAMYLFIIASRPWTTGTVVKILLVSWFSVRTLGIGYINTILKSALSEYYLKTCFIIISFTL